jgi:hypothetical protein
MQSKFRIQSVYACYLALAVVVVASATATHAGVIPTIGGVASVSGGGTASVTGPFTPIPDNFPSAITANFAAVQKTFTSATVPIDIVLNVTPSSGVTEYLFAEGIFNASGIAWNDYHIELGFGIGDDFEPDPTIDLEFDATPAPSSADFASFTLLPQSLSFFDGLIPANTGLSLSFTIDVPNLPEGVTQFTLRQYPSVVPEPGTAVLAMMGMGLLLYRHRSLSATKR